MVADAELIVLHRRLGSSATACIIIELGCHDTADVAIVNTADHLVKGRRMTHLESHDKRKVPYTLGGLDHAQGTISVGGGRLLAIYVFVGLHRSLKDEGMGIGRSGNDHSIHIVVLQQFQIGILAHIDILLLNVGKPLFLVEVIEMGQHLVNAVAEQVGQGVQFHVVVAAHGGDDTIGSTVARTDKAYADGAVHRFPCPCSQRLNHRECRRCR